jgi:putative NADH-flavin reductase
VTAAVYRPKATIPKEAKRAVVDVHDPSSVALALDGQDAVVSALGSWETKSQDILTSFIRVGAPLMKQRGVWRVISLTGADARVPGDKPALSARLMRFVLHTYAPKVIEDGEEHLRLLEKSGLHYTVIRSPKMKDGPPRSYRLGHKSAQVWWLINRWTIATAMCDQLESDKFVGKAPIIKQVR